MHHDLVDTEFASRTFTRPHNTARRKFRGCERAWATILCCHPLQRLGHFFVLAFAKEIFRGLFEADDGDPCYAHHEDNSSTGEPEVAPAHVVGFGAGCSCCAGIIRWEFAVNIPLFPITLETYT